MLQHSCAAGKAKLDRPQPHKPVQDRLLEFVSCQAYEQVAGLLLFAGVGIVFKG
jgi:hypothetical protein